eukprot:TRINITY_DN28732_c0_g1_i1.p1 TRINITY_DN28732_c0_g1~~TRINITY_DN28732_c0_g1_i1.p1  ORF type:complete len:865 (-),score=205.41 TRINITY_DN28732_c0_g1_i1:72-2666(-)
MDSRTSSKCGLSECEVPSFRAAVHAVSFVNRIRPHTGVRVEHVLQRMKTSAMERFKDLDPDEQAFASNVMALPALLMKSTQQFKNFQLKLTQLQQEQKFPEDLEDCAWSALAGAIHQTKLYTTRLCWAKHVRPYKVEVSKLKEQYERLKKKFTTARADYLRELVTLKDELRGPRASPDPAPADVVSYFDPTVTLEPAELTFVCDVVSEKLKMIFETNPGAQHSCNLAQMQQLLHAKESNEVATLKRAIRREQEENKELRCRMADLEKMAVAAVHRQRTPTEFGSSKTSAAAESVIKDLEEQIGSLRVRLREAGAIDVVRQERDELQAAYDLEVAERISLQSRLASLKDNADVLKKDALTKAKEEEAKNRSLSTQVAELREQLGQAQAQSDELRRQLERKARRRFLADPASIAIEAEDIVDSENEDQIRKELQEAAERKADHKVEQSERHAWLLENENLREEVEELRQQLADLRHQEARRSSESALQQMMGRSSLDRGHLEERNDVHGGPKTSSSDLHRDLEISRNRCADLSTALQEALEAKDLADAEWLRQVEEARQQVVHSSWELRQLESRVAIDHLASSEKMEKGCTGCASFSRVVTNLNESCQDLCSKLKEAEEENLRLAAALEKLRSKASKSAAAIRSSPVLAADSQVRASLADFDALGENSVYFRLSANGRFQCKRFAEARQKYLEESSRALMLTLKLQEQSTSSSRASTRISDYSEGAFRRQESAESSAQANLCDGPALVHSAPSVPAECEKRVAPTGLTRYFRRFHASQDIVSGASHLQPPGPASEPSTSAGTSPASSPPNSARLPAVELPPHAHKKQPSGLPKSQTRTAKSSLTLDRCTPRSRLDNILSISGGFVR